MASATATTEGFLTLTIQMPGLPSFPHTVLHEIRLRRNMPKVPTDTDRRTLFLKNIPVDSTEPHLRAVFAQIVGPGRFEAAFFEDGSQAPLVVDTARVARVKTLARKRKRDQMEDDDDEDGEEAKRRAEAEAANLPEIWGRRIHKSGSSAVVLLADEKSVDLVLKAVAKLAKCKKNYPIWADADAGNNTEPLGSAWIAHHLSACSTRTDHAGATSAAVRVLFKIINQREKEAAALAKRLRNEPDEDGFVTVTRGSGARTAPASRTEAEEKRRKMEERVAKRKDEMGEFYRFQRRERLKREHDALRNRFEADRERVRAMRAKRAGVVEGIIPEPA